MQKKFDRIKKRFAVTRRRHVRRIKLAGRHPFIVPVATVLALAFVCLIGFFVVSHHGGGLTKSDALVVIISHDHQQQIVPSREPTVKALLKKLNISVHEGDVVEPALATKIDQDQFRINIYRAVPVKIDDGGTVSYSYSAATTARSIANQSGLQTYAEDNVKLTPTDNFVTEGAVGEQVSIQRATPITINLYGTTLPARTQAKTVGDLLKEKKISLAKDDQVAPAVDQPIISGSQIFIVRNGTKLVTETQSIPMPTQTVQDGSLAYGTSAIRQQGSNGQQVVTYQVSLQNGVEVSRTAIQTIVTTQPVTQIVVQGTSLSGIKGDMALAGISATDYQYADYIISHESGWCPTKAQGESYCPALPDNQFTSLGYGLCQATPGSKMSSAGDDWATNPVTQLRWCNGYAMSKYGGWAAAYNHWINYRYW